MSRFFLCLNQIYLNVTSLDKLQTINFIHLWNSYY